MQLSSDYNSEKFKVFPTCIKKSRFRLFAGSVLDKEIMSILVWLLFMSANVLGFWSILKGWSEGEFTYSRNGSFEFRKIRREDNPSAFHLYLIGILLINITFLFFLIILGYFAFQ